MIFLYQRKNWMVSTHLIGTGKKSSSDKSMKMTGECGNTAVGKCIQALGNRSVSLAFFLHFFLEEVASHGRGKVPGWEKCRGVYITPFPTGGDFCY